MKRITVILFAAILAISSRSQTVEPIRYGDFENWVTRHIKESRLLGGDTKTIYEIAPNRETSDGKPYANEGGSLWATSNVLASPAGIVKTSNAVFPDVRGNGRCCKMTTLFEHCKAIGIINIDVIVAGSIFLGRMFEPIKSTSNPYSKMEMGVPFTKRPKSLQFDYKVSVPPTNERIYSSGLSKKKTIPGSDCAEAFIILQRRWEDADGNLYAKRVGTGREHFTASTNGWVNKHKLDVHYGDITGTPYYKPFMALLNGDDAYYARNSHGKMVPVNEVGWDDADAQPTHLLVMFSAGSGKAYIGTLDLTLWVDNVALVY